MNETSIFKQTEKMNQEEITHIKLGLKASMTLEQIQLIALKLNINVTSGKTTTGKPKNKTKSTLIEEIKNFQINI
jgi:hypothetical protein